MDLPCARRSPALYPDLYSFAAQTFRASDENNPQTLTACVQQMDLPCARWSPGLYQDLRQAGDGTGAGMLKTWFNSAGWPTSMGPEGHEPHCMSILALKDVALMQMLRDGEVPLRPGEGLPLSPVLTP